MTEQPFIPPSASRFSIPSASTLDLRASIFPKLHQQFGLGQLRVLTLILVDAGLSSLAWLIATTYGTPLDSPWAIKDHPLALLAILITVISIAASQGLYQSGSKRRDYWGMAIALTFAQLLLIVFAYLYQPGDFVSRSTFLLAWLFSVGFVCGGRALVDLGINQLRRQGVGCARVFVICEQADKDVTLRAIAQENCYKIAGWSDASALDRGNRRAMLAELRKLDVKEMFVAWDAIQNRLFVCWFFQSAGITLHILPTNIKPIHRRLALKTVGGLPSLKFNDPIVQGLDFRVKRLFDVCFAAIFLLAMSPVYLAIAVLIKRDSPGPIFYKQTRIGLHGKPFQAWKFRTMVTQADQLQSQLEAQNITQDGILFKIKSDPRITKVGKFLRRYSLDELPQIFNVLLGEMSLVGPRPLPVRDIQKFSEYHFLRHEVLPGVTGLWQVSGRSDILDFDQVMGLDMHYIENWSLGLDMKILLRTVMVVLLKKGAC